MTHDHVDRALPSRRIILVPQGSPEWLEYRRLRRNASESAAVLGVSPWMTPYQLWLAKTGRFTQPVTQAMQRGLELEPVARTAYEERTGLVMEPLVMEDGAYSASLDGLTLEGDLLLEIKCPLRGTRSDLWQDVSQGVVPEHYLVQVQHQLMVTGAEVAHLWVFDGSKGVLAEVAPDEELMRRIRQGWDEFQGYLDRDSPPPLGEGDTRVRSDAPWTMAAQVYSAAKAKAEAVGAELEQARQALIGLAGHPREQGGGVTVTRYWKAGSVDYKKVPQLQGVDLEPFRKKGGEEVRVTISA